MNPLIPRQGVCDPHIHIFDGRAYLYTTHDSWVPDATHFRMTGWQIWSSEDLVHWHLEQTIYPGDLSCGPIDQCWAVDAARKNGKYYWYYSVGSKEVGVAVSDAPAGPFREALGHALVGPDTPPLGMAKWDPCVFVDDDGSEYLICGSCFGTDEYQIARLNEDMCSLAEPLRTIEYRGNVCREDKASIHKENGIYYLSHASFYATADNIYGPYTYRGNTTANIDHGCFFTYRGQTYQASGGMDTPNCCFRASFLTYCHYRKNGEIVVDQVPTGYGVGQYDASWVQIRAWWHSGCRNASKRERPDGGFEMAMEGADSWLFFPNVCHMERNPAFCVRYANQGADALLEIRRDGPEGTLLGSCPLPATAPDAEGTASCRLRSESGHHSLYLVVRGGSVALDWFSLTGDKRRDSSEAFRGKLLGNARCVTWDGAAVETAVRLERCGDGVALLLDGGAGGKRACFLRYSAMEPASVTLFLDGWRQTLALPRTDRQVAELRVDLELKPGVNGLRLCLEPKDRAPVILDSLRTEFPRDCFQSYPAANGGVFPVGNGFWNSLPQREWDQSAYSGRCVNNLCAPGQGVTLTGIQGGASGGEVGLMIRYGNGGPQAALCRLEINGADCGILQFSPTGGTNLEAAGAMLTPVRLTGGANRITLTMEAAATPGLCIDAFSVVPLPTRPESHGDIPTQS